MAGEPINFLAVLVFWGIGIWGIVTLFHDYADVIMPLGCSDGPCFCDGRFLSAQRMQCIKVTYDLTWGR